MTPQKTMIFVIAASLCTLPVLFGEGLSLTEPRPLTAASVPTNGIRPVTDQAVRETRFVPDSLAGPKSLLGCGVASASGAAVGACVNSMPLLVGGILGACVAWTCMFADRYKADLSRRVLPSPGVRM